MKEVEIGKGEEMRSGKEIAIVGVGPILYTAQKAIEKLETENSDLRIGLYDLKFLKPMDNELLHEIGKRYSKIYTIEDGTIIGGHGRTVNFRFHHQAKHRGKNAVVRLQLSFASGAPSTC